MLRIALTSVAKKAEAEFLLKEIGAQLFEIVIAKPLREEWKDQIWYNHRGGVFNHSVSQRYDVAPQLSWAGSRRSTPDKTPP